MDEVDEVVVVLFVVEDGDGDGDSVDDESVDDVVVDDEEVVVGVEVVEVLEVVEDDVLLSLLVSLVLL